MRLEPFVVASLIGRGFGKAAELRTIDVPEECLVICNPVVLLSNACYIEEDTSSRSSTSPILVVPAPTSSQKPSQTAQQQQQQGQQGQQAQQEPPKKKPSPPQAQAPAVVQSSWQSSQTYPTQATQQAQEQQHTPSPSPPPPPPPPHPQQPPSPPPNGATRPCPSPTTQSDLQVEIPAIPNVGAAEHYVAFEDKGYGEVSMQQNVPQRRQNGIDQATKENAERFCLCKNKSFNVQSLAGLCASCMAQNAHNQNQLGDIQQIMSECAFTSTVYTPAATKLAQDLTIVALVPTVVPVGTVLSDGDGDDDDDDDYSTGLTGDGIDGGSASSAPRTRSSRELRYTLYLLAPLTMAFLCF